MHLRSTTIQARLLLVLALALAMAGGGFRGRRPSGRRVGKQPPGFGPNVTIFDPSMPVSEIQATVDAIYAQQVDAEMGTNRYALLFKPGVYGTADRAAADEGRLLHRGRRARAPRPTDVTINGKIEVYNRCLGTGARATASPWSTSGARCPT